MAESFLSELHRATTWSIVLSILMIAAGVLAIASPAVAGVTVTVIVGWMMVFSGALHFAYAFRGGSAGAIIWEILLGMVYGLVGFYVLANPALGLASLTFVIACYLFVEGVIELVLSTQLRHESGSGWLMFDAIVTLLLALMIWGSWVASGLWAIGTLVGISMLFSGASRLMFAYGVRSIVA